jgi:hypothetical protein
MATKGRGGDSMLVHMTPGEVQALQALAQRHGGTLTINPETGQPEANFLKKILPMVAGFALGPAGFGLSAGMAGLAVGGVSALATGSLSRGLMAGLGAYGGAGLGAGLANMGSSAVGADALAAANASADPIMSLTAAKDMATATGAVAPTGFSALTEGATAAFNDPKAFVQGMGGMGKLAQTGLAAISPIMADEGVQTATPKQDTGYIRQKKFNPYTQQYVDLEPVKASEWGSRRFSDFAGGGIVALAAGGVSDAEIQNWMAANKGASDATIAAAMQEYSVSPQQLSSAMGYNPTEVAQRYAAATAPANPGFTNYSQAEIGNYLAANPNADIAAATQQFNADPRAVNQYIVGLTQNYADPSQTQRGTGTFGYYDALKAQGIDANELFAANQGLTPNYQFVGDSTVGQMARAYDVAGEFKGFDPQVGNQVANDIEWVKRMDELGRDSVDIARATGLSIGEVQAREAAARAAMKKEPVRPIVPGPIDKVPYVPGGVSGGGNTVVNPNGTITTTPNIPGRPEGGFTGIGQLRDVYTQGGGSLGQSNLFVPKTLAEMYERYGNTGGSEQAYKYLMNRGSVDVRKPVTQSGDLMLPYSEAVLGMPASTASAPATQKYIFDRKTRQYVLNPAYVDPNAPKKKDTNASTATSTEPIVQARDGGVMRMALGGLGALAGGGSTSQYNLGGYSDGGRLLRGPGDGVSDSIPATIGNKQPARLADGEFVIPARIVSELGNGSTEAGARKLYAMMDRVQKARRKTTGKRRVATNTRADKYLPA